MKRTFLLSLLALIPAALLPLSASSQAFPSTGKQHRPGPAQEDRTYRYEVYAGYGYTSLNQVNGSRYGLQGINATATRDWGKYFGLTADGAYYSFPIATPVIANSTIKPTVYSILAGPSFHADLYEKYSAFVHALIGAEHTGGTSQTPNLSFAGGLGGGAEYKWTPRISIRASGDLIGASFSLVGNSPLLGYSPHRTWNSRASVGVVYHF